MTHGRKPDRPAAHTRGAGGSAPVLVVGATRILRPAALALAARGHEVLAVARAEADLHTLADEAGTGVRPLPGDAGAPEFEARLHRALGGQAASGALVYAPAAAHTLAAAVAPGRPAVLILTSRWAAPPAAGPGGGEWTPDRLPPQARPAPGCRQLVLGWRLEQGAARWHSPEEISRAALALYDAPANEDAVLGTVRPWSSRPG